MTLKEKINVDYMTAFKAKDAVSKKLLSVIKGEIQTIEKNTIVNYCLTSDFSPDHSFSISPFNTLEIQWPINTFKVSEKDLNGIALDDAIKKYSESLNLGLN